MTKRKERATQVIEKRRQTLKEALLKIALSDETKTVFELNPVKARDYAKELYFTGMPNKEIAELVGVNLQAINSKASKEKWHEQRTAYQSEIWKAVARDNKELITTICRNGLRLIDRGFRKKLATEEPLSPREMKDIGGTILDVDKFMRLDNGLATEIRGKVVELTHTRLMEILHDMQTVDPHVNYALPSQEDGPSDETTH
jgi:hypothetical protein